MTRNVEIKAKIHDPGRVRTLARNFADGPAEIIEQFDVFFPCENGRLKLRFLGQGSGQLIHYARANAAGPKTSTYQIHHTDDPDALRSVLTAAHGELVVVKKRRHLYLSGRTRIHVDAVDGLGDFLELEVVLDAEEPPEAGVAEAERLMKDLEIQSDDLIEGAYADMLP